MSELLQHRCQSSVAPETGQHAPQAMHPLKQIEQYVNQELNVLSGAQGMTAQ